MRVSLLGNLPPVTAFCKITLLTRPGLLTPMYNWLILVFGEPLENLPSSAPVKQILDG